MRDKVKGFDAGDTKQETKIGLLNLARGDPGSGLKLGREHGVCILIKPLFVCVGFNKYTNRLHVPKSFIHSKNNIVVNVYIVYCK